LEDFKAHINLDEIVSGYFFVELEDICKNESPSGLWYQLKKIFHIV
jgi:hypothetical protein